MSLQLNGTDGVTFNDGSEQWAAASPIGTKNLIINGDMRIDQRNAGASVTPTSSTYTLDRWQAAINVASKFSVQQVTDSPVGATHSLKATSLSAYSIGASEICTIRQHIEGYNTAHLDWGTSDAKTVTLSFWVKSSLTGTFGGSIMEGAAASRSYPFTYTISSANTWEQKTITIAGDTSGTWSTTNTSSIDVLFSLGSGSSMIGTASTWAGAGYYGATGQTNLVATNGATLQISLVQLEVGDTATPFEHRPYDMELARCQRYYQVMSRGAIGGSYSSTQWIGGGNFNTQMRATPSASQPNGVATVHDPSTATYAQSSVNITATYASTTGSTFILGNFSGMNSFRPMELFGGEIHLSAEL